MQFFFTESFFAPASGEKLCPIDLLFLKLVGIDALTLAM